MNANHTQGDTSPELIPVESLIHHQESIDEQCTVEDLHDYFRSSKQETIAIVDQENRFRGIIAKAEFINLLSGLYGFSLYRDQSVLNHIVKQPLIFQAGVSYRDLAEELFANDQVPDIEKDAVVIDENRKFTGIILAKDIVRHQWLISQSQANRIRKQEDALIQKNRAIFESKDRLRLKQGQYKILFENDILGVALIDRSGQIDEYNETFIKLSGINKQNPKPDFFNLLVDEQKQLVKGRFGRLNREQNSIRLETVFQHENGNLREIHGIASLVRETGQIAVQLDDVTNRRHLERRMASQEKGLLVDSMLAGIAHEINNKLSPIVGFSQLYSDSSNPDADEIKQYFRLIQDCASEASSIVTQL